jgi:hypothetical protein
MRSLLKIAKYFLIGLFSLLLIFALARAWWLRPKVWLEPITNGYALTLRTLTRLSLWRRGLAVD